MRAKEPTPDYTAENERRKKALQKEEEFLEDEVMGKGVEIDDEEDTASNIQSEMERAVESNDEKESAKENKKETRQ